MELSRKVPNLTNICGVAIDLSAYPVPSYSESNQSFYDSYLNGGKPESVYFGKSTVQFSEAPKTSRAGDYWEVTAEIRFPSNDKERAKRIEKFRKAKFLILELSTGLTMILGRNDYFQNTKPKVLIESNAQLTAVKFIVNTIAPTGFLPEYNSGLLPHSIPVNLLNAN